MGGVKIDELLGSAVDKSHRRWKRQIGFNELTRSQNPSGYGVRRSRSVRDRIGYSPNPMTERLHGFEPILTEVVSDSLLLEPAMVRVCAVIGWTDSAGMHRASLDERASIGTAPDNTFVIADPTVSRLHAELYLRDRTVWVRDLESRNGTSVNGVQVADARVPDGGRIRVGRTELTVEYDLEKKTVELWPSDTFGPLIGRSMAMRECFARIARIVGDDATVLVQGETGTGKELVAKTIHEFSTRATQPFVIVDCAALPEHLLEIELFGHAKGAHANALHARGGAFECADGGTVFLDEIGELPLTMQAKLLRVLESRTVRRMGESQQRDVDVRVISATNRDLRTMVNAGAFRDDLYFRLAVLPINLPPLRARPEDISLLAESFMEGGTLGPDLMAELSRRPWFGNVRELRNFVARARVLGTVDALTAQSPSGPGAAAIPATRAEEIFPVVDPAEAFREIRGRWLDHLEREYIRKLLGVHQGNVTAVARSAGLDRTYIYRLMRKHDL